jgi:hypothetical protein
MTTTRRGLFRLSAAAAAATSVAAQRRSSTQFVPPRLAKKWKEIHDRRDEFLRSTQTQQPTTAANVFTAQNFRPSIAVKQLTGDIHNTLAGETLTTANGIPSDQAIVVIADPSVINAFSAFSASSATVSQQINEILLPPELLPYVSNATDFQRFIQYLMRVNGSPLAANPIAITVIQPSGQNYIDLISTCTTMTNLLIPAGTEIGTIFIQNTQVSDLNFNGTILRKDAYFYGSRASTFAHGGNPNQANIKRISFNDMTVGRMIYFDGDVEGFGARNLRSAADFGCVIIDDGVRMAGALFVNSDIDIGVGSGASIVRSLFINHNRSNREHWMTGPIATSDMPTIVTPVFDNDGFILSDMGNLQGQTFICNNSVIIGMSDDFTASFTGTGNIIGMDNFVATLETVNTPSATARPDFLTMVNLAIRIDGDADLQQEMLNASVATPENLTRLHYAVKALRLTEPQMNACRNAVGLPPLALSNTAALEPHSPAGRLSPNGTQPRYVA